MDKTPEQERRRRHPHELIGPHCDVYSLGKSIENATNLLGRQYETLQLFGDTKLTPDSRPKLELVYSSDLWNLMFSCQNEDARNRPRLHYLHKETKSRMEYCRAISQVEKEEALSKGIPECFHSNVLYKRMDRKRFESDATFRSNYRKANLAPVWEILGPLAPQNVLQATYEAEFTDAAHFNERTGQPRGAMPGRMGRKIEKKGQEKRKGAGRVQQGLRGLLRKMNFFS